MSMMPLTQFNYKHETILVYDLSQSHLSWIAAEHKVLGEPVIVGTALIEMVCSAVHTIRPNNQFTLFNVLFIKQLHYYLNPLIVIRIVADSNRFSFEIIGQGGQTYVEGKIEINHQQKSGSVPVDRIRMGLMKQHDLTHLFASPDIEVGAHWKCIRQLYKNETESLLFLSIDQTLLLEMNHFFLHPSLFDAALHLVFDQKGSGFFIPWMYKRMTIYERMPSQFYSYCRLHHPPTPTAEILSADFLLLNEQGVIFIEITGFLYKKSTWVNIKVI